MISMSHGVNDIISTDGCLSLNVDIYSISTLLAWLKSGFMSSISQPSLFRLF